MKPFGHTAIDWWEAASPYATPDALKEALAERDKLRETNKRLVEALKYLRRKTSAGMEWENISVCLYVDDFLMADIPACPHCCLAAGACADYPNCPNGPKEKS